MLRRPPTAISLEALDIARYEEARQRKLLEQKKAQNAKLQENSKNASGPAIPEKPRTRTAEDRIMGTGSGR